MYMDIPELIAACEVHCQAQSMVGDLARGIRAACKPDAPLSAVVGKSEPAAPADSGPTPDECYTPQAEVCHWEPYAEPNNSGRWRFYAGGTMLLDTYATTPEIRARILAALQPQSAEAAPPTSEKVLLCKRHGIPLVNGNCPKCIESFMHNADEPSLSLNATPAPASRAELVALRELAVWATRFLQRSGEQFHDEFDRGRDRLLKIDAARAANSIAKEQER